MEARENLMEAREDLMEVREIPLGDSFIYNARGQGLLYASFSDDEDHIVLQFIGEIDAS